MWKFQIAKIQMTNAGNNRRQIQMIISLNRLLKGTAMRRSDIYQGELLIHSAIDTNTINVFPFDSHHASGVTSS